MFRAAQKILPRRQSLLLQHARSQSQQASRPPRPAASSGSGGAGMGIALGVGGVTAAVGGIIGYAAFSDENRKAVDDSIPGIQYVTDAILGVKQPPPPPVVFNPKPKATPTKPKENNSKTEQQGSLLEKKLEREKKKEAESKKVEENLQTNEKVVEKKPSSEKSADVKEVKPKEEKVTEAPKQSKTAPTTSVGLTVAVNEARKCVTSALMAADETAEEIKKQLEIAMKQVGAGNVGDNIHAAIGAVITGAEEAMDNAQKSMSNLSESIGASKKEEGASVDSINLAEEAIQELAPALDKVKAVVSDSINNLLIFETLNNALLEARDKFTDDLKSLLPSASELDADKQQLLMLGQSYLKISALQKALADKDKAITDLIERGGGVPTGPLTDTELQCELDKLRHQLSLQHRSDLSRQKEELEAEIRGQLKRQAAAHTDHLNDMLCKKETEITKAWQTKLFDELIKEKDRHLKEIASVKGKVMGLKSAVDERADADKNAVGARKLWLACSSLQSAIRLGKASAKDHTDQLEPLGKHMAAISVAGVEDDFVNAVVGSLKEDEDCVQRGVYTEQALRHRFRKVTTIAKRVALVPENGGSLLRYLLSYMQSMLIIQSVPQNTEASMFDAPVDMDALNTFDIIDRAKLSLEADDLTGCLKWLNQLTGESRNVSKDWVIEARRTLAAKQAADALMAHAAAVTAKAL